MVGASDPVSFLSGGDAGFVAAIEVSDTDQLKDLLEKSGAADKGEQSGATIYEEGGTEFAVDGSTVVFAGSREQLNQALARHGGDDSLDEDTFNSGLEGVGDDGIAQGYLNLQSLLSGSEGARAARKVKWIAAVEAIGLNAKVQDDAITIDFRIRTNPDGLTDADLRSRRRRSARRSWTATARSASASAASTRPWASLRRRAGRGPSDYGDYAAAKTQLERKLGVDVEKDILGQLSGDISASISLDGKFGIRVEPKDPAAFDSTLSKIASTLPLLADGPRPRRRHARAAQGRQGLLRARHARRQQHRVRRQERGLRDHERPGPRRRSRARRAGAGERAAGRGRRPGGCGAAGG